MRWLSLVAPLRHPKTIRRPATVTCAVHWGLGQRSVAIAGNDYDRRPLQPPTPTWLRGYDTEMLTIFGSIAVAVMMLAYWFEPRSKWLVLAFAAGSAATAVYSWLVKAFPVAVVEAVWTVIALDRFYRRHRREPSRL